MPSLDDIDPDRILVLEKDRSPKSLDRILELIRKHYGLARIAYACPAFRGRNLSDPSLSLSYGDAAGELCHDEGSTPADDAAASSSDPADWASFRRLEEKAQRVFSSARETGRKQQGLTIPVRGPTNDVWALFSVISYDSDEEWAARRYELMKDMVHVAHFVHQRALELQAEESGSDVAALSAREIEALQWAADGLHPEDTGFAMRLSPETVRAYLDSARYKLKALNRTHAISKAIAAGLIH